MKHFTAEQCITLIGCCGRFTSWFENSVDKFISQSVHGLRAEENKDFLVALGQLEKAMHSCKNENEAIESQFFPLLKRVLIHVRRAEARARGSFKSRTHHSGLWNQLDDPIRKIEAFMEDEWFSATTPASVPQLTEFLTVEFVESA